MVPYSKLRESLDQVSISRDRRKNMKKVKSRQRLEGKGGKGYLGVWGLSCRKKGIFWEMNLV